MKTKHALIAGLAWFLVAIVISFSGWLGRVPMPFPQVVIAALTVGLLLIFARASSVRVWALQLDPRALLGLHLVRFIGLYFIFLYFRSELPYAFALPAGVGDTLVAGSAVMLLLFIPRPLAVRWHRWVWVAWNIFGLMDIGFVVLTAAQVGIANPASMSALTRFPLGLLPTFLVPLIIVSHIVLFVRLSRPAKDHEQNQKPHPALGGSRLRVRSLEHRASSSWL